MDASVECTHCKVLMTTWVAAGSTVRYWQCPFCARTHSSLYGDEVFRSGAGARVVARGPAPTPAPARERYAPAAPLPQASAEDINWAMLKARAHRWFARLEAEGRPAPRPRAVARVAYEPALASAGRGGLRHA